MQLRKLELYISFNGKEFYDFYEKYGQRTVQATLEQTLSSILEEPIHLELLKGLIPGCSVRMLPVLFETTNPMDEVEITAQCNLILDEDIRVCYGKEVPLTYRLVNEKMLRDYEYRFLNTQYPMISHERGMQTIYEELDLESMQMAAELLVGENDFSSFTTGTYRDPFRTIYHAKFKKQGEVVTFSISGNGFLENMVQMLVGELIRIGKGELKPEDILSRIRMKTPDCCAPEMSVRGLTLSRVTSCTFCEDIIHNNNDFADYYIIRSTMKKDGNVYIIIMRCEDDIFPIIVEHAVRVAYMDGAKKVLAIDGESERIRSGETIGIYKPRVLRGVNVVEELMEFRLYGTWYQMEK